jgi:ribonuclease PH
MHRMPRENRQPDELRPVRIQRRFTTAAPGSVLIRCGDTHVLCTASITESVPEWRVASGLGWVTAEYDMLPGSTPQRRARARDRIDGRTQEIQRLIGRSLRAIVNLDKLGPRTITLDCDVLQADGGTRTAAITGAYVALRDALVEGQRRQLWGDDACTAAVAAVSVGLVGGEALLDLDYREDVNADVDCNLVLTSEDQWVEVQLTGERATCSDAQVATLMEYGRRGIRQLLDLQERALAESLPTREG